MAGIGGKDKKAEPLMSSLPSELTFNDLSLETVHDDIKKRRGLSQQTCTVLLLDPS